MGYISERAASWAIALRIASLAIALRIASLAMALRTASLANAQRMASLANAPRTASFARAPPCLLGSASRNNASRGGQLAVLQRAVGGVFMAVAGGLRYNRAFFGVYLSPQPANRADE